MTVQEVVQTGERFVELGLVERAGVDDDGNPRYRITPAGRRAYRRARRKEFTAGLMAFWANPMDRRLTYVAIALVLIYVAISLANAVGRAHGAPV